MFLASYANVLLHLLSLMFEVLSLHVIDCDPAGNLWHLNINTAICIFLFEVLEEW